MQERGAFTVEPRKKGSPKGAKRSVAARQHMIDSWNDPVRKQKYKERLRKAGRYDFNSTSSSSFVDPDFDEGL